MNAHTKKQDNLITCNWAPWDSTINCKYNNVKIQNQIYLQIYAYVQIFAKDNKTEQFTFNWQFINL